MIPRPFLDDLLARIDIVEIIDQRVKLKKTGKNYSACCPFHEEKSPSFTVATDKQFYFCFGCHASGNAIGFLMDYERLQFREAVGLLARQCGLQIPDDERGSDEVTQAERKATFKRLQTEFVDARIKAAILTNDGKFEEVIPFQKIIDKNTFIIDRDYKDLKEQLLNQHKAQELREKIEEYKGMLRDEQMIIFYDDMADGICGHVNKDEPKRIELAKSRIEKLKRLILDRTAEINNLLGSE